MRKKAQVQDNVSFLITLIHLIHPYVLTGHIFSYTYMPYVLCHLFNDLDYRQSGSNNDDNPIDLFTVPIHQQEHVKHNECGLFDDDDDEEDNLTLFGKMIIMI